MYSFIRSLCAFALLTSPAVALDIFEDAVITEANAPAAGEDIFVHGAASLTLDTDGSSSGPFIGPWNLGDVTLNDTASLVIHAGKIKGRVNLHGDNSFTMDGGLLDAISNPAIKAFADSSSVISLDGGEVRGGLGLSDGSHTVTVGDDLKFSFMDVAGMDVQFTGYGNDARYYWLGGTSYNLFLNEGQVRIASPGWLLYPSDQREPADIDGSGTVDLGDLNLVRNNFGNSPTTPDGDTFPLDGRVDLEDLNRVRNNFGASTQPVPEPSSILLALLMVITTVAPRIACR